MTEVDIVVRVRKTRTCYNRTGHGAWSKWHLEEEVRSLIFNGDGQLVAIRNEGWRLVQCEEFNQDGSARHTYDD